MNIDLEHVEHELPDVVVSIAFRVLPVQFALGGNSLCAKHNIRAQHASQPLFLTTLYVEQLYVERMAQHDRLANEVCCQVAFVNKFVQRFFDVAYGDARAFASRRKKLVLACGAGHFSEFPMQ